MKKSTCDGLLYNSFSYCDLFLSFVYMNHLSSRANMHTFVFDLVAFSAPLAAN